MTALRRTSPAPVVRIVHLGLGAFFRAHQAWYTALAPDAADWGIAAFAGRSRALADALAAQDGLYTLVTRAADGDRHDVLGSVVRAHAADDHGAWLGYFRDPRVAVVTTTVTEAGYLIAPGGGLDREAAADDVRAVRADAAAPVRTAPGRLVAGLLARRAAGAGPLAVVPCDNVPSNGSATARVVGELAALVDESLPLWLEQNVSFVTTMVDRITPRTTDADVRSVREATGVDDAAPVVTEPFSEWVLSGAFPAGRPRWEDAGATFTDDATPFEQRKLWLLNGAHSLLAYAGSACGHTTTTEATADPWCRAAVEQWWDEAAPYIALPADDLADYRSALLGRWANPRIRHSLAQIAEDGSAKVPVRILSVLRAEREAGRLPEGALRVLAAWIAHLRGAGAPVVDARAEQVTALAAGDLPSAVRAVLADLDPALAEDGDVLATVVRQAEEIEGTR